VTVQFEDQGYEWHEATNFQEEAAGRRVFIRGAPLDPAVKLARLTREVKVIADRLSADSYQHSGIDPDGLKTLIDDLRGLLP
jgi:hypothetical protein